MDRYEKAKKLLNRKPTEDDEPFESLVGWHETKVKAEVESVKKEKPKKKVKKKWV